MGVDVDPGVVRWRAVMRGGVQGVGFRFSCQRQARRLGVAGWVTNRDDGSVEAVFEGTAANVARAVEWCRRGPAAARVTGVDLDQQVPEGLGGFRIV